MRSDNDRSSATRGVQSATRLPEIDWLRGLAAISVFAFHLASSAGFDKRVLPPFTVGGHAFVGIPSPFSFGASGVTLFFVISGFCLVLQRLSPDGVWREIALAEYVRHRVARILPAYWAAIALSIPVAVLIADERGGELVYDLALHVTFLHGFSTLFFLSLNGALWSMATEVQFYVAFPLLVRAYRTWGPAVFLACAGLIVAGVRTVAAYLPAPTEPVAILPGALLSYQLPGRLLEFALGMWLAVLFVRWPERLRIWSPLAALLAVPVGLYCRALGPSLTADPALGLMYTALVGLVLSRLRGSRGWLATRLNGVGARFGRMSYSFFLIHYPVIYCIRALLPHLESPYTYLAMLGLVSFPATLVVAFVLYSSIELPLWRRFRGSHPAR